MPTISKSALDVTSDRPYPLPARPWRMRQRWNDLLFAHWPIPAAAMQALLPPALEVDTFDGYAWAGIVPFWMDRVANRLPFQTTGDVTLGVPTTGTFAELNLRTYVRSRRTGLAGVFFFSLDCTSPLAVIGARTIFHLPYFFADISRTTSTSAGTVTTDYRSRRQFTRQPVRFEASFAPSGPVLPVATPGTLEHFLTERYALFTPFAGRMLAGDIHHVPWPLQPAEAEIRINEIPAAHGLTLPDRKPVLHFARHLDVTLWTLRKDK